LAEPPEAKDVHRAEATRQGLFRNRSFVRLFSAGATSIGGQSLGTVALTWLVFSATKSAADVAYVALSNMVAVIAFSLFAGTLVDRSDRRRMMIYSDAFRAASIAVLAVELHLAGFSLPSVLAVSFVIGTFSAVFYPAERSLLPTLIGPEEVADANGLILTANSVFQAAANGVGGALVAIAGVVVALGLNAATFTVSALLIASIAARASPKPPAGAAAAPRRSFLADTREGVRYLVGWRGLLYFTLSGGLTNLFLTMVSTFVVVYAAAVLHGGAEAYGLLLALFTLGFAPGALMVGRTRAVARAGWVWCICMLGLAPSVLLLALSPDLALAAASILLTGFILGYGNATWLSFVQLAVPGEMQGRYFGVDQLGSLGVIPVGQVVGALLIQASGVRFEYSVAAAGLLVSGLFFVLSKDMRSLRYAGQGAHHV
jgi:MFS family permease